MGLLLAAGRDLAEAQVEIGQAVEGVQSAAQTCRLAGRLGVEMPIVGAVARVLAEEIRPSEAVEALLAREPRPQE